MKNKLNLAEILKECPKGMKLYSPICGECTLEDVGDNPNYSILVYATDTTPFYFTADGRYTCNEDAECLLFPSKEQRDWSKFKRPFQKGDIVYIHSNHEWVAICKEIDDRHFYETAALCADGDLAFHSLNTPLCSVGNIKEIRFATDEERNKLFDAIQKQGYQWNAETKTLEKLEVEKFDMNTLVPFESKVLVREKETDVWQPAFYGFFNQHNKRFYTTSTTWLMCIPYNEDTKHLIGTTSECNKYYKTWDDDNRHKGTFF